MGITRFTGSPTPAKRRLVARSTPTCCAHCRSQRPTRSGPWTPATSRWPQDYAHLAPVVDWYSRRVLARRLSISMDTGFCMDAVKAVYLHVAEGVSQARSGIGRYIEFYNTRSSHLKRFGTCSNGGAGSVRAAARPACRLALIVCGQPAAHIKSFDVSGKPANRGRSKALVDDEFAQAAQVAEVMR
jgi:hypothetical protein